MTQKKIAIIGGGIVGSTAAYYLAKNHHQVTLFNIDRGQASKAAAGIICPWFSKRRNKNWNFLVSKGAEFYRLFMEDLQADGFDSQQIFQVNGALLLRKNSEEIIRDQKIFTQKITDSPSIQQIKTVNHEQIKDYFPLLKTDLNATWVKGGACVDGKALINLLKEAFVHHGGEYISAHAKLRKYRQNQILIQWENQEECFDFVLLAAGAWLGELLTPLGLECDIEAQKGQLFSVFQPEWQGNNWPVVMPPGGFDIIPFPTGEIIIGASHEKNSGFDLSLDPNIINNLKQLALPYFPSLKELPIHRTAVGIRAYTPTSDVLIGQVPHFNNLWAISGLGASGLTNGPYLGYQWYSLLAHGAWDIDPEHFPINKFIRKNRK